MTSRVRVHHLRHAKDEGRRLTMLTAYDYPTARIFDAAGVDMILVGDSVGNVMHGEINTLPVTLDEMVIVTRSVARACARAMVVADLPFGSYESSPAQALASATRLFKESGAQAVKLEGGQHVLPQVEALVQAGMPVVGHLGFTPQAENTLGGYRVQGRSDTQADQLTADALALQNAGACALVLEMVPAELADRITDVLDIPTIGIGAGAACDGQVLVWTDMAGLGEWSPKFSRQFGQLGEALRHATDDYITAVRDGSFPGPEHSF